MGSRLTIDVTQKLIHTFLDCPSDYGGVEPVFDLLPNKREDF